MARARLVLALLALVPALASGTQADGGPPPPTVSSRVNARLLAAPWELSAETAGELPRASRSSTYTARYSYLIPRATADRPDMVSGNQIHVVYVIPNDAPDEQLDMLGVIDVSVHAQNAWFASQTATTGAQRWVFDTFQFTTSAPGAPQTVTAVDVSFLRTNRPGSHYSLGLDAVVYDLDAAGFNVDGKRYLVYAAMPTGGVCGESYFPIATGLGPVDGEYAAVFLDSVPVCGGRDFAVNSSTPGRAEAIAQHELVHTEGAAPLSAPHQCSPLSPGHVCTTPVLASSNLDPESPDLLFPYVTGPLDTKVLDRRRDDYYRPHLKVIWDLSLSPYLTPR